MKPRNPRNAPAVVALRSAASAVKAGETLGAAAAVIAARTEMAALALANPSAENDAEMSRMVSEKLTAFGQSGAALARSAQVLAGHGARYAADEAAAAGRGLADLAACRNPVELMQTHGRLMTDFFARAVAHSLDVGAVAHRAGERALAPVHRTVADNARRLRK